MMKPLLAGAACLALIAACNEQGASPAVDKAQDMAAAPVGQVSAATLGAKTVDAYVPNAAMGDMYEIMAADIALERSQDAEVKRLATMIKADHTDASNKMKGIIGGMNPPMQPPAALDQRRQGLIDNLRSESAADFDNVFLDQQIAAHNEALTLHRGFSDNTDASAAPLAAHARSVVPKIEAHLRQAEQLKAGAGA